MSTVNPAAIVSEPKAIQFGLASCTNDQSVSSHTVGVVAWITSAPATGSE
jgi:hypothetical protein